VFSPDAPTPGRGSWQKLGLYGGLRAWDFLHCPAGTEHIVVGAGPQPCVVFMAGARAHRGNAVYPRNELALRRGVSVEADTDSGRDAYAPFPAWEPGAPESSRRPFQSTS